jgi:hypothetical protein
MSGPSTSSGRHCAACSSQAAESSSERKTNKYDYFLKKKKIYKSKTVSHRKVNAHEERRPPNQRPNHPMQTIQATLQGRVQTFSSFAVAFFFVCRKKKVNCECFVFFQFFMF